MFADPQSVTINSIAISLPRVGTGPTSSSYKDSTQATGLVVSHNVAKRSRHTARLDILKTAADPLVPATNRPYSMSAYLVVDVPLFGFTVAEQKLNVDGLTAWLVASSGANVTKLLGGES